MGYYKRSGKRVEIQIVDFTGGAYRNRTDVHGFAIRCITTLPTRRHRRPGILQPQALSYKDLSREHTRIKKPATMAGFSD